MRAMLPRLWFWIWALTRPRVVRRMCFRLPPWHTYQLASTGQLACIRAYADDGTVRAVCWRAELPQLPPFVREVYGLDPNDFRRAFA